MATGCAPSFTKLKKEHPFNPVIEALVKEGSLLKQELQFEYYAQEELSLLARSGGTLKLNRVWPVM